jgi:hypothetical protein
MAEAYDILPVQSPNRQAPTPQAVAMGAQARLARMTNGLAQLQPEEMDREEQSVSVFDGSYGWIARALVFASGFVLAFTVWRGFLRWWRPAVQALPLAVDSVPEALTTAIDMSAPASVSAAVDATLARANSLLH